MLDSTRQDYMAVAERFIRLQGDAVLQEGFLDPRLLKQALEKAAWEYRPDYWRRIRRGLSIWLKTKNQSGWSEKINKLKNDCPVEHRPKKQKRQKSATKEDTQKIINWLANNGYELEISAIFICFYTGIRPSEFSDVILNEDGSIYIQSSKKRSDRGLNRRLRFETDNIRTQVRQALVRLQKSKLNKKTVRQIQDRIRYASRQVFPRRKQHYSLYSWRHQLGSDLKASGLNKQEVAYIMGHQSTASVDRYGDRRTGGRAVEIRAAESAERIAKLVRDNESASERAATVSISGSTRQMMNSLG